MKFEAFSEYLMAVKTASEGGNIDKRLVRLCKRPELFSEAEVEQMEELADKIEHSARFSIDLFK